MNDEYALSSAVLKQQVVPRRSSAEMNGADADVSTLDRRSVLNAMPSPTLSPPVRRRAESPEKEFRSDGNGILNSVTQAPSALSSLFMQAAEVSSPMPTLQTSSSSLGTGGTTRVVRAVTPTRNSTPRQITRDITPVRTISPRLISQRIVSEDSGLTRAALAATFQGMPAVVPQQVVEVLPPITFAPPVTVARASSSSFHAPAPAAPGMIAAPQPVVEVLPPVAAGYPRPVGLSMLPQTGSFRSPVTLSRPGSYVPPVVPVAAPSAMLPGSILQPPSSILKPSPSYVALTPRSYNLAPAPTPPPAQPQEEDLSKICLTAGVPDIEAVEQQKMAYGQRLDTQARCEEELLRMKYQQEKVLLHQAAEAKKRQALLQIEQEAKQQELELDQQHNVHLMGMQQELQSWKLLLQQQASSAILDFQARKSQEDLLIAKHQAQQAQQISARQKREAVSPRASR